MERGTFYQLRNLINRRNVKKEVKSDVNAYFIEIVVTGYIVSAVLSYLGMACIDDNPVILFYLLTCGWKMTQSGSLH